MIGATIDHPHSQIMAFTMIPSVVEAELSAGKCDLYFTFNVSGLFRERKESAIAMANPASDQCIRREGSSPAAPASPAFPAR
jgi:hypothetical protein